MKIYAHDPRFILNGRDDSKTDAVVVREIWCENVYEVFDGDLADTGIVIDIGANIGAFSVFAAHLGAKKVIAVEPEKGNLNLLRHNTADNQQHVPDCEFIIEDSGIAGQAGTAQITDEHGDSRVYLESLNERLQKIKLMTLEDLFKKYKLEFIDVLKLDIEGLEGQVLINTPENIMKLCRYITLEYDQHAEDLGAIVEKLSKTHQVKVVGAHGGMIFGKRY